MAGAAFGRCQVRIERGRILLGRGAFHRVGEDDGALRGGNVQGSRERKNIDDEDDVRDRNEFLKPAQAPFAADVEFSLIEGHAPQDKARVPRPKI